MRALGLIAAESLSCELAAVYLADGERVELVERGWALTRAADQVGAALKGVLEDGRFPYCVQDASIVPLPSPLDEEPGIRSYYLLELHGPRARGACSSRTPMRRRAGSRCSAAGSACASPTSLGPARRRAHAGVVLERGRSASRRVREARRLLTSVSASGAVKSAITSNHT